MAGHAVTAIHYLTRKELGAAQARRIIGSILEVFRVASVGRAVIQEGLHLALPDFEDAVTAAAAWLAGCDYVVTRDPKGFRGAPARPVTPEAAITLLGAR